MGPVRDTLKHLPRVYRRLRQARFLLGNWLPPRHARGIVGRVHWNDLMFAIDTAENYRRIGWEACALIERALERAGRRLDDVERVLDFGCGYGRVARALSQKISPARICAFDVDPGGPSFCAEELGVQPLYFDQAGPHSTARREAACTATRATSLCWNSVPFESYDLIWVGSVFTHLSQTYLDDVLPMLTSLLRPRGVLVFTTLGDESIRRLAADAYGPECRLAAAQVLSSYHNSGFGFVPYPYGDDANVGTAWGSEAFFGSRIEAMAKQPLKLLFFAPHGWDAHQDVFAYQTMA